MKQAAEYKGFHDFELFKIFNLHSFILHTSFSLFDIACTIIDMRHH